MEVFVGTVCCVDACPEVEALATLCERAGTFVEHVYVCLVGGLEVGLNHGCLVLLGVEGEGKDGVILEVLADRKIEPLGLSGQSDAGSSVGDNFELIGWTDATVEEDSWRRQSTCG